MEKFIDHNVMEYTERSSFWDFKGKYVFVDNWFLMRTPYPMMIITGAYLLFVLKLGPDYMKNRQPFILRNFLLIYNAFQVTLSVIMFYLLLKVMWKVGPIHRTCLTDTNEDIMQLTKLSYYYFACKITELMDTVLFVLRKKQNQVTFLHVYHHFQMAWNTWIFLKYEPGYWMLFLATLNSFVHTVMYTYYGLSAYPNLHRYLWWKKYITSMQMIQFALNIVHVSINYFINECRASTWLIVHIYFNLMLFIYLFSRFYKQSYSENNKNGAPKFKLNGNVNDAKTNGVEYRNGNAKKVN